MMRAYSFLTFGFSCLATALLLIGIMAMPIQGLYANNPNSVGGQVLAMCPTTGCVCAGVGNCDDTCFGGDGCNLQNCNCTGPYPNCTCRSR